MLCMRPLSNQFLEYDTEWKKRLNNNWKKMELMNCRNCIGCKINRMQDWGTRALLESKYHKQNYFITLTYKPEKLPLNKKGIPTIKPKDLTTFINTLRKRQERNKMPPIKYIGASEYGSRYNRPHYHIIAFGLELNDIKKKKGTTKKGNLKWESETISKIWNKGIAEIGTITKNSGEYCAKYTTKKTQKLDYKKLEIEPEKIRVSKGIGEKYYWDKINLKKENWIMINNKKTRIPEYYKKLEKKFKPMQYEINKQRKKYIVTTSIENALLTQNTTYTEHLGILQRTIFEKLKVKWDKNKKNMIQ